MERQRKEPLFDTVNTQMAESLEAWHESPYSSESAGKINTLIRLAQSAGYGITLEIDNKGWEGSNAAERLPDVKYRIDGDVAVIEIDPQQKENENGIHLYAFVSNPDNPLDEYSASDAYFIVRGGGKQVAFSPREVLGLKILEGRTFGSLKEVKDAYWPDISDEEFLQMMDKGEFPEEGLRKIVERAKKAEESE